MKYYIKPPFDNVDAVLDTDAYNEIDDQFAISYMILSPERINVKAIYAAPFYIPYQETNRTAYSPEEGMEQSYDEINHILDLADMQEMKSIVFKGSRGYLKSDKEPQISPAAKDLAERAMGYTKVNPLYVICIGCLTNIASAILINPEIADRIVVVTMSGSGADWEEEMEFNLIQDMPASKIVYNCGADVIQLPGMNVATEFRVTKPELEYWLGGKNPLADYLAEYTAYQADSYAKGKPWSRVLWDVPAVAWLMNDDEKFMKVRVKPLPEFLKTSDSKTDEIGYIYWVNRDNIFEDLVNKVVKNTGCI